MPTNCEDKDGYKKKQCQWLNERVFNNCFKRDSNDNDKIIADSNDIPANCLERIIEDAKYQNIGLDQDYGNLALNNTMQGKRQTLHALGLTLDEIERKNKLMSEISDTDNASLELKNRFTYSALSKLILLAFFIILFISTIIINNDTLYDITFSIIMMILLFNLYIFMKP